MSPDETQLVPRKRRPIIPHQGPIVLLYGIMGIILCMPYGILAWIWAHHDLKEMRAGRMDPSGETLTQVGRILAIFGVFLHLVLATIHLLTSAEPWG